MRAAHLAALATAFVRARWRQHSLQDRARINAFHEAQLAALQAHALRHFPFYRGFAGQAFNTWPLADKALLLAHFAAMNRAGIAADEVREALARGEERLAGCVIGQSTGTSGNRGYYAISDAERFTWLGTILSKTLPNALWRRHKVALALPGLSDLYRSAPAGARIALAFFDLAKGAQSWADDLAAFAPDTIVAPPKVLRWLAEHGRLPARHIFSGAEVLDPIDRAIIEEATGSKVREIYMATEGLFGVACPHGTLHLAEDVVHFEFAPQSESALVSPIVTDFTRREQAMIRYRMNDLFELSLAPCPCGSAFQPVQRIVGRADDIFHLAHPDGTTRMVTPDVLRNALVDAHPAIRDFRVVQTGAAAIHVTLADDVPADALAAAEGSLGSALARAGASAAITISRGIATPYDAKLRRVRRDWR